MILFPDQERLISKVNNEFKSGSMAVLMQSATGSGKSFCASELIRRSLSIGNVIWFVVPRLELVRQMSEVFSELGISHSFIAADKPFNPLANVFIVSLQSVVNRLDKILVAPTRIIIDEVHFGGAGLDRVVKWGKSIGARILGLSATPNRADGRGLGDWFDTMVCGESIKWLIDNKRLAKFKAYAPDILDLTGVGMSGNDYNQKNLRSKMENDKVLIGNAVKHYQKFALGRLGITFGVGINHSQMLAEAYRNAGVVAMHMDGNTPEDERIRIAKAYARREIMMLCNAELLTFGYDIASASGVKGVTIETMMDCAPTKSLPKQMQKWGRNLRYDGNVHMFFDHANNIDEHGLPDDERDWSLESKEKKKRAKGERNIVKAMHCSKCYYCHPPAPKCPNCGHEYPMSDRKISEVEAELIEIQEAADRKNKRMAVGMAKTLQDLKQIASERGYSKGWIFKMAQVKGIKG